MTTHRLHLPQLRGGLFLADGGLETTLIHHDGVDLPHFAAFELDAGDPLELAAAYRGLRDALPGLCVVGGCCGTDHRHVEAIADALAPRGSGLRHGMSCAA